MTTPTDESKRLVRLCAWLAGAAVLGLLAAAIAIGSAVSRRVAVVGATDSGRFIPVVPLDKPHVNESRVQAFAEECIRRALSHDFLNFRQTLASASGCFTPRAADLYAQAMDPLIADLTKRRMVMTPVINLPPAVVRAYNLRGVYTYEVQAEIVLTREGTRERIPAERFKVFLRVSRADIEESVKGVLISYIELKPLV